ncbi:MAG: ATP-dependent helicase [Rhodocyclaceae bacterium]|nr:ATP-dependent helicase [Rhodocyclaceae bacterium]
MSAISLNSAQRDAVVSDEHLLCVACPGSGKTRVLVEKARHTLSANPAANIVLTTFSRDAAQEIRDRIAKSLGEGVRGRLKVGTFHALALSQLRKANALTKVLGEIETEHLIRRAIEQISSSVPFDEAEERISRCKVDRTYAKTDPAAVQLMRAYDKLLERAGGCDFTDIMLRCVSLMDKGEVKPLSATHIYCDEFQDIDRIQFEWLRRHLSAGMISCAVGDDDQSVFGFRRALGYAGMMEFAALTGARLITLDVNYRSTEGILGSAGNLIKMNADRVPKALKAARGQGPWPRLCFCSDAEEQAERIVGELDELLKPRRAAPDAPAAGTSEWRFMVRKGQAAVLARINQNLADIEAAFIKHRVPYVRSGRGLWKTDEAQALVSLLNALDSGKGVGLEVALRFAKVADSVQTALIERGGGSLWALVESGGAGAPGGPEVARFFGAAQKWRRDLKGGKTGEVIKGAAAWLGERAGKEQGPGAERSARRLKKLGEILGECFTGSLSSRIAATSRDDADETGRVTLATFHASKGLEWDHVILADVVKGLVPKIGDQASDAAIEEERRVFYVAMTRARETLTVFSAQERKSEFLADAGLA